jgi:hypothetical protein
MPGIRVETARGRLGHVVSSLAGRWGRRSASGIGTLPLCHARIGVD